MKHSFKFLSNRVSCFPSCCCWCFSSSYCCCCCCCMSLSVSFHSSELRQSECALNVCTSIRLRLCVVAQENTTTTKNTSYSEPRKRKKRKKVASCYSRRRNEHITQNLCREYAETAPRIYVCVSERMDVFVCVFRT